MSITLPTTTFCKNGIIKIGAYKHRERAVGGPLGLLAHLNGFKTGGGMHAHRYNQDIPTEDGTRMAPPASRGQLPREYRIPADAIYVVFSYDTPIAWVTPDGVVTVPDVHYSATTTHHQGQCRAWLCYNVQGSPRYLERKQAESA